MRDPKARVPSYIMLGHLMELLLPTGTDWQEFVNNHPTLMPADPLMVTTLSPSFSRAQ